MKLTDGFDAGCGIAHCKCRPTTYVCDTKY